MSAGHVGPIHRLVASALSNGPPCGPKSSHERRHRPEQAAFVLVGGEVVKGLPRENFYGTLHRVQDLAVLEEPSSSWEVEEKCLLACQARDLAPPALTEHASRI